MANFHHSETACQHFSYSLFQSNKLLFFYIGYFHNINRSLAKEEDLKFVMRPHQPTDKQDKKETKIKGEYNPMHTTGQCWLVKDGKRSRQQVMICRRLNDATAVV